MRAYNSDQNAIHIRSILAMSIVTRVLDDGAYASSSASESEEDYQPASVAFLSAAVIWAVIIGCFIVLVLLRYQREREYLFVCGRGKDVNWTASLTSSILVCSENVLVKSETDANIRKSAMLDTAYNFQTIFLALGQASISMAILGGIQLNFDKTIRIVLYVVLTWTILIGVIATLWMSRVSETIGENDNNSNDGHHDRRQKLTREGANPTDTILHNRNLCGNPLVFVKQYIELSFFKPIINTSELVAYGIYQDVGRDGSRTLFLGIGQLILLFMYAFDVVDDGKPDLSSPRLYGFYCCGILLQIAYMNGQDVLIKSIYSHFSFWGNALRAARTKSTYKWEPPKYLMYHRPHMVLTSGSVRGFGNEATIRLTNSPFLWLRFLCSTIINVGGLNIITLFLPLQLASSDNPLEFVMASIGAYYILGIDDYAEAMRYSLVMKNDDVPVNVASPAAEASAVGRVEMTSIERRQGDLSEATDYQHMA